MGMSVPSLRRSMHIVQRNLTVYKRAWMVIFTGFFEPVFYLLGIGVGVGSMVGEADGLSYAAFVAPGLLAVSCMNGAITESFFNIFFKLHYQKTYDGILATPMRVADVAFGEALWALGRGSLYAAGFLVIVLVIGSVIGPQMILSPFAVLAWPAAVLVAAVFAAVGLCITSLAKKIQDFDIVQGLVVMPMFLFSGAFFPVDQLPSAAQWVVRATPLYHGVAMLRQLTTGAITPGILIHVAYLVVLGSVAFVIAMHRLERTLIK
jgi:lipooligosaccharide transport system permease protein